MKWYKTDVKIEYLTTINFLNVWIYGFISLAIQTEIPSDLIVIAANTCRVFETTRKQMGWHYWNQIQSLSVFYNCLARCNTVSSSNLEHARGNAF